MSKDVKGLLVVLPERLEAIGKAVVDAAFVVHSRLGPGLLEGVYETCMYVLLQKRGFKVERQVRLSILFEGVTIHGAYEIDLLVEDCVVIELKSVEHLLPVHGAQVLTYLRLSRLQLGFLINFNVPLIKDGIHRRVAALAP